LTTLSFSLNAPATPELSTPSLHDALPISGDRHRELADRGPARARRVPGPAGARVRAELHRSRHAGPARDLPAHPAQLPVAHHRDGLTERGDGHPDRVGAVVPRSRRP